MTVQCHVCRRIRDNGEYRLPWPGELPMNVTRTYCPECAEKTLGQIRDGKLPAHYRQTKRKRRAS